MKEIKPVDLQRKVEDVDLHERTNEIRRAAMFPILEYIPLLEKEISKMVYGDVIVMMSGRNSLSVRIKNADFTFGYELQLAYIEHFERGMGIVIDDCLYHYQQEILKRYFKKGK